ncbi:MAG: glycosyltransferase family 2 protein [Nitrospiraceae bacterium]|nr:glycosyltransferase family 2 protein [Nitrospiraceae bacterium]MDA8089603.1 glycosyltransferase family 2 protein [Nitrospiraceae bacterium]
MSIALLIPTLNEEKNLPFALESCKFADDIYILDSGSTDGTREIALNFGAQFFYHAWEGYARQKNWGLQNLPIGTDWVFILDADEEITAELRKELLSISKGRDARSGNAGFYVNRFFVWRGKEIRHCGYYPSWNLRFFKRGKARYEDRSVHEHMVLDGTAGYCRGEMRHEDRRGRRHLWRKHLRYAQLEAGEMFKAIGGGQANGLRPAFLGNSLERRRAVKERIWPHLPSRWLFRFTYMYIIKRGFLDGEAGLDLCLFMSRYEKEIARAFRRHKIFCECGRY